MTALSNEPENDGFLYQNSYIKLSVKSKKVKALYKIALSLCNITEICRCKLADFDIEINARLGYNKR